jgi:hypothetical protein
MRVRTALLAVVCFAAGFGVATWLQAGRSARETRAPTSMSPADADASATSGRTTTPIAANGPRETVAAPATSRSVAPRVPRHAPPDEPPATEHPDVDRKLEVTFTVPRDVRLEQGIKAEFGRASKTVRARFLMAGRPVEGVVVENARSDAEGRISLDLPRNYRGFLVVQQPDGVQFRVDPPQDDAEAADLGDVRLSPATTISGVVVDESDKPVVGAAVALLSTDMDCRTMGEAKTDRAGRFSIDRVGPYRYEVYARASPPAGVPAEAVGARLAAVRGGEDVRLVARPMFPVTFHLLDDATGKPIVGTWISCYLRRAGAARDASLHEHREGVDEVKLLLDAAGVYEAELSLTPAPWSFIDYYRRLDAVDLSADRENVIDVRLRRQ